MSLQHIRQVLLDVLKEVQTMSGREWVDLPNTAKPINDVSGFDSVLSVEASAMVEHRLGGHKLTPCSVFHDGTKALSIDEIVQNIQLQLPKIQEAK